MQLYKISFTTTPKVYIGISSKSAKQRFKDHCNKNKAIKSLIHKAICKYGDPILTILGECDDWELLCMAEQEAIEKYNSFNPGGYNLTKGGDGGYGVIHTEQTKEKFRLAKLGKKQSKEHASKSAKARIGHKNKSESIEKTISSKRKQVINSNGNIFKSVNDAVRYLKKNGYRKASQGTLSTCLRGERNNAYGMSWSFDISKTPEFNNTKKSEKQIKNISNGMLFKSVSDAVKWVSKSRNNYANNQSISKAARDNSTAYGYEWSYDLLKKTEFKNYKIDASYIVKKTYENKTRKLRNSVQLATARAKRLGYSFSYI